MTIPLIEELAAQEHASWTGWTKWMLGRIEAELKENHPLGAGEHLFAVLGDLPCVRRWRSQVARPYERLSEKEKESDRKEVREKWDLYERSVRQSH